MPRRTGDPISLHWRGGLPLYVLLSLLYVALVSAQYNVTVGANNALLEYQPYEAWEKITDQVLGDGTARVTRQKGARVSLSFTGMHNTQLAYGPHFKYVSCGLI